MSPEPATDGGKAILVEVLEGVAAILGLDEGRQRLEVIFEGGSLRRWYAHREGAGANQLAEHDSRAALLLEHLVSDEQPGGVR